MYKLSGVDGKEYIFEESGMPGGNSKLKNYGQLDSWFVLSAIRRYSESYEKSRVLFVNEKTALAAGYRPCGNRMRKQK